MKIHLLAIDPQVDFLDQPNSRLPVPGATADMDRLATMVDRLRGKIADIHVTQDSHRKVDISHPMWFVDSAGKHPSPFTLITAADVESGRWNTTRPGARTRTIQYLKTLESRNRYVHIIWPEHCLIGDEGHNVWRNLAEAVHNWEHDRFAMADIVTKGSNPWTEHFSAVQAEVPDPTDPSTHLNTKLIRTLEEADVILLAGEALSHCCRFTIQDIVDNLADPKYAQKMVLLTDCMSPVPDPPGTTLFSDASAKFLSDMRTRGMRTDTSSNFLL